MACQLLAAEMLLERIRRARVNFAHDPDGPAKPREGLEVIERWIDSYFAGTYYGNIPLVPDEKHRARCAACREKG